MLNFFLRERERGGEEAEGIGIPRCFSETLHYYLFKHVLEYLTNMNQLMTYPPPPVLIDDYDVADDDVLVNLCC